MTERDERCSCLAARATAAPASVRNPPGLPAIAYRIGRHGDFRARLLTRLSSQDHPALAGLGTRADDDFTVGLLDALALLSDIFTFYQERIANESYLRTATERRSVLELARLTGYRPAPGVAATTSLLFGLDDAPGAAPGPVVEVPAGTQVKSVPGPDQLPQTFETGPTLTARREWGALAPVTATDQVLAAGAAEVWIDGATPAVRPGDGLLVREGAVSDFRLVAAVEPDSPPARTRLVLDAPLVGTYAAPELHLLRQRAAVFGHNAPDPCLLNLQGGKGTTWTDSPACGWLGFALAGNQMELDGVYAGIASGSLCVLRVGGAASLYRVDAVEEVSLARFGLSAKVSRLTLAGLAADAAVDLGGFGRRDTTVFLRPEPVTPARRPVTDPVTGSRVRVQGELATLPPAGQRGVVLEADGRGGWVARELVTVQAVDPGGGTTLLQLAAPLAGRYAPAAIRLSLNVTGATHGETAHELLGSGDAQQAWQRFTLKQAPLTFVTADAGGVASTLEVRVDDVLWRSVESFADAGPRDRVYTATTADDGKVTVQFGDGRNGARLPTGQNNVRARYRKGVGREGMVSAGQLSLLMARPLGVKSAVNPLPAEGGEDPEPRDAVRVNAPSRVLTLDRAVSRSDYAAYARTFPGIAKARADRDPSRPAALFLTVAGIDGAAIADGGDTQRRLLAALAAAGDPGVAVRVKTYRPATFDLSARLTVLPDHQAARVAADAMAALGAAFSFAAAEFAGAVALSRVIAVLHGVAGVAGVDVDTFRRSDATSPSPLEQRLVAAPADPSRDLAAELLTAGRVHLETVDEL